LYKKYIHTTNHPIRLWQYLARRTVTSYDVRICFGRSQAISQCPYTHRQRQTHRHRSPAPGQRQTIGSFTPPSPGSQSRRKGSHRSSRQPNTCPAQSLISYEPAGDQVTCPTFGRPRCARLPFSLLCDVVPLMRGALRHASPYSPWSPSLRRCLEIWHGDLVRLRGETRNRSKAEIRGLLPSVSFLLNGSVISIRFVADSRGSRTQTQKRPEVTSGLFCICAKQRAVQSYHDHPR